MATGPFKNSPSPKWVLGDRITICDGVYCLTPGYKGYNAWVPIGGTTRDPNAGYKNASANVSVATSGAG